jgi:hypothetical protein
MIAVCMSNYGTIYRLPWIDIKTTCTTVQSTIRELY